MLLACEAYHSRVEGDTDSRIFIQKGVNRKVGTTGRIGLGFNVKDQYMYSLNIKRNTW